MVMTGGMVYGDIAMTPMGAQTGDFGLLEPLGIATDSWRQTFVMRSTKNTMMGYDNKTILLDGFSLPL